MSCGTRGTAWTTSLRFTCRARTRFRADKWLSLIPGHSETLDVVRENKRFTRCFLFYAVTRTQSPTNTRLNVFYSANLSPTAGMKPHPGWYLGRGRASCHALRNAALRGKERA